MMASAAKFKLTIPEKAIREEFRNSSPSPDIASIDSNLTSSKDFEIFNTTAAPKKNRAARILIDTTREFGRLNRPSREKIEQFKEVFYQLIDRIEDQDRRLISAMLARSPFTPRAVALYFAQDREEIAAPFLLFSTVLGDIDLRAIARKKGQSYADIIAKRRLPMDSHTISTLKKVDAPKVGNSSEDRPKVMAGENHPVLDTPEMPAPKWLSGDEIVALAGVGGKLGRASSASKSQVDESAIVEKTPAVRPEAVLPTRETRELLDLARKLDNAGVASKIENLCCLDSASTLRLIQAASGEEIVYLVKALGMPSPQNMQFILMLCPRIGRNFETYTKTKALLKELDAGICRMIFNEIGARFDIPKPDFASRAIEQPAGNFSRAVERRRNALEQSVIAKSARNAQNASRASHQRIVG